MSIQQDQVVAIEYELREEGKDEVIDTNVGGMLLEFIVGKNNIISGLENEIVNLGSGGEGRIVVAPKDGYGEYSDEGLREYPRSDFQGIELQEGMSLYGQGEDGQTLQVSVKSFDDENVTVDYNHPLAGKTLVFDVKVLEVRDAVPEELQTGLPLSMQGGSCCGSDGGSCCSGEEHDHAHGDSCCGSGSCSH